MTPRLAWLILADLLKDWATRTLPLTACAGLAGGWLAVYLWDARPDPSGILLGCLVMVGPSLLGLLAGYALFTWRERRRR